jgi:hypothetical protein
MRKPAGLRTDGRTKGAPSIRTTQNCYSDPRYPIKIKPTFVYRHRRSTATVDFAHAAA